MWNRLCIIVRSYSVDLYRGKGMADHGSSHKGGKGKSKGGSAHGSDHGGGEPSKNRNRGKLGKGQKQ